jgi:hypothetical protein
MSKVISDLVATLANFSAPNLSFKTAALGGKGTTCSLNFSAAGFQTFTLTSPLTCVVSFTGSPPNNSFCGFRVTWPASGSASVTLPAMIGANPAITVNQPATSTTRDFVMWFSNGVFTLLPTPAAFDNALSLYGILYAYKDISMYGNLLMTNGSNQYQALNGLAAGTLPTTPGGSVSNLFASLLANRGFDTVQNATGQPSFAQSFLGRARVRRLRYPNNSVTPTLDGAINFNLTNGLAATAVSTGNGVFGRALRASLSTTATAGSLAYAAYNTSGDITVSPNSGGQGGFFFVTHFGPADANASQRKFAGLSSSTATPTNVDPAAGLNQIGCAEVAASNNVNIVYGGSTAQTAIDLGSSFPINTANTDWYELALFAPTNSSNTVYYQVTRLNSLGTTPATGTLTGTAGVALPASTTFLAPRYWITNNATAAISAMGVGDYYYETDL